MARKQKSSSGGSTFVFVLILIISVFGFSTPWLGVLMTLGAGLACFAAYRSRERSLGGSMLVATLMIGSCTGLGFRHAQEEAQKQADRQEREQALLEATVARKKAEAEREAAERARLQTGADAFVRTAQSALSQAEQAMDNRQLDEALQIHEQLAHGDLPRYREAPHIANQALPGLLERYEALSARIDAAQTTKAASDWLAAHWPPKQKRLAARARSAKHAEDIAAVQKAIAELTPHVEALAQSSKDAQRFADPGQVRTWKRKQKQMDRWLAQAQRAVKARAKAKRKPARTSTQRRTRSRSCCKYCSKGKPCGDTCISRRYTCHKGPGCACWG